MRSPDGANVITTAFLLNQLDLSSTELPLVGEKASAAIRMIFFKARRFDEGELAQSIHHPREPFTKVSEESSGE